MQSAMLTDIPWTREFPQINLAFSLHSPFNDQRDLLVPANRNYPLKDCLRTLEKHALSTKRKIFLAYLLLDGYNDSQEHAQEIAKLIGDMNSSIRHLFHVNLLRYNPAFGIDLYERTKLDNLER